MNFNIGSPSNATSSISSSTSSDSNDDEVILQQITSNNNFVAQLLSNHRSPTIRRGSIPGHVVIERDREISDRRLFNDYFAKNPTFDEATFQRRFRMSRSLFMGIADAIKNHDNFFLQRRNCTGRTGLSTFHKITAALRILAYGVPADAIDEYFRIGESTSIECVKRFCHDIVEVFGEQYLRSPIAADVARLLHIGQYTERSGKPTIILEAVADYDLWIWHAYFGMPGSNNDINVLDASNQFSNLSQGIAPPANYVIKGKEYNMGYYLADGIYPKWVTLVQTIHDPRGPKKNYFAMKQVSCGKDVEHSFGALQSQFAIVAASACFWNKSDLHDIMSACIIIHNMRVEDERDMDVPIQDAMEAPAPDVEMVDETTRFNRFLKRHKKIKDKSAHIALRDALIDHLWDEFKNSED